MARGRIRDGLADENIVEPGDAHNIAGARLLHFDALQAFKMENGGDGGGGLLPVAVNADGSVAHLDLPGVDLAKSNTPQVVGVVQICNQALESVTGMGARRRDVANDGVEKRLHRGIGGLEVGLGVAVLRAREDDREIHLLIVRVERNEEVPHQIEHLAGIGVVAVDLVNDHDGLGSGLEGFAQHKARLSLGTIRGIHHEQDAVDHVHDPFHLAAKVSVARSVHDVDVVVLILERRVLGADGNSFFPFQVHGVHNALLGGNGLVCPKCSGLL